jgi:hypothetical protein
MLCIALVDEVKLRQAPVWGNAVRPRAEDADQSHIWSLTATKRPGQDSEKRRTDSELGSHTFPAVLRKVVAQLLARMCMMSPSCTT